MIDPESVVHSGKVDPVSKIFSETTAGTVDHESVVHVPISTTGTVDHESVVPCGITEGALGAGVLGTGADARIISS